MPADEISELLSVLAHEMRTPIAAIMGYQELLSDGIYGSVDERGKEPLDRIGYSARQLLHLIDGVQEVTLAAGKHLQVELEAVEPAETLATCLRNADADATGRNVKLESQIPAELPAIITEADLFCRTVDLALAAAIKTSHGATLRLSVVDEGDTVATMIENTGISLESDDPDLHNAGQRKLTGAGLRIAIIRALTTRLGGTVELATAPTGTKLVLRFPVAPSA